VEQYERVLQLKPDSAEPWYNLGKVLDQQGKLSEAALYFQQALTLATAQGNTSMAEAIHIKLKSYPPALLQPRAP
jgi:cytochrome c-type biogenesis protein CcmH/NrfG